MAEQSQGTTLTRLRDGSQYLDAATFRQGATLALLTGKHMLTVGPPGHCKTEFAAELFQAIDLEPDQTHVISGYKGAGEEILVNYLDPRKMEEGKLEFLPGKSLLNVVLAYVDEVGALSRVAQQALLQIMQSRRFSRAGMDYVLPLDTMFAGGNHAPEDPAVRDRFAIQIPTELPDEKLPDLVIWANEADRQRVIPGSISWSNILALREKTRTAKLTDEARDFVCEVSRRFRLSPRRVVEALVPAAKAWATQEGRRTVTGADVLSATPFVALVNTEITRHNMAQIEEELATLRSKVTEKAWMLAVKRRVMDYKTAVGNQVVTDEAGLLNCIRLGNSVLAELPNPDNEADQERARFLSRMRDSVLESMRECFKALKI